MPSLNCSCFGSPVARRGSRVCGNVFAVGPDNYNSITQNIISPDASRRMSHLVDPASTSTSRLVSPPEAPPASGSGHGLASSRQDARPRTRTRTILRIPGSPAFSVINSEGLKDNVFDSVFRDFDVS